MARHSPCPLCGPGGSEPVFRLRSHQVARCAGCGLLYNASFGAGQPAAEVFAEDYYRVRHREAFAAQIEAGAEDLSLPVYGRWLGAIEAKLGRGRLLDVGAGLGSFLRLARDRGWEVQGVELSPFAADFIRRRHGVPVFAGDLAGFEAPAGGFDLVTFWDSLEHVERPRENLERAFRLLRPGGALLLTTDNFDCLIGDVARALYRLSGGALQYPVERLFIDRNTVYFSARDLVALVRGLGYAEVSVTRMEYPLGKIRTTLLERAALFALYALAAATRRQAQITLVARRPAS